VSRNAHPPSASVTTIKRRVTSPRFDGFDTASS